MYPATYCRMLGVSRYELDAGESVREVALSDFKESFGIRHFLTPQRPSIRLNSMKFASDPIFELRLSSFLRGISFEQIRDIIKKLKWRAVANANIFLEV